MGRVFLAEDGKEGRQVALKFLPPDFDLELYERFREEVSFLSHLSHPNLIRIFDYEEEWNGEDPNRIAAGLTGPFFSMEYADGLSLDEAAANLSPDRLLDIFIPICRGLHYLHSRGLLHRDLKPANILVGREGVKILDFGLAGLVTRGRSETAMGTLGYMAPEALEGNYDHRCDLYSLGVLFQQVSKGRRLPDYFAELLDRLRSKDPNERPGSALSLIKYLNRHIATPFAITPEEERGIVLDKPPWVERDEEKAFWKICRGALQRTGPTVLQITGPTGSGRTRFLEEIRWKLLLQGHAFSFYPDLHEASPESLANIQIDLRRLVREPSPRIILLEYDQDLVTAALAELLNYVSSLKGSATILLKDLSDAQTRALIRGASIDQPADPEEVRKIVQASGGRPLLVLEYLRHRGEFVPGDFAQSARAKVQALSPPAQKLLSLVVAHPEPPEVSWMERLGIDASALAESRIELQSKGIIEPPSSSDGHLCLRHPSLQSAYQNAFTLKDIRDAHRTWLATLEKEAPTEGPSQSAAWLLEHALNAQDSATARSWALRGLDFLTQKGRWSQILHLCGRLGTIAETPMDRAIVHAHMAAVHYRLGRYDDALRAYDDWYANKPDDGTNVETVKHRLLTGRTLFAAGRTVEARQRLTEGLLAGDSSRHAHHRTFHAQTHLLLAQSDTEPDRIFDHLKKALALASAAPVLLGEVERCYGEQEQKLGRTDQALEHFRKAAEHYRTAGNPQAEATAKNSSATALRWGGRLKESLEEIGGAIRLAEEGNELLQIARYRENRALILMDLGRYGDAIAEREKARDVIESFGTDLDRTLVKDHDAELDAFLGRSDAQTLESLQSARRARTPALSDPERLEESLQAIEALESPELRADLKRHLADAFDAAGLDRIALSLRNASFLELQNIRHYLPEELKMDFEKRPDLKKLNETLGDLAPKAPTAGSAGGGKGGIPAARFRQFCAINRQMALKNDMGEILDRVIDAAIEITGAERGFILLKDGKPSKSPIAGFDVKVARNLNREILKTGDFELSLSLVKQAIDKAAYVLTDDAFSDPRFSEKKSVMDYRLRSVLVVPLEEEGRVFGVIYLDHRYEPDCFSEEDLTLVNALAAQASLAIQKARFIDELTRSRDKLAVEVKDQAEKIEAMAEELTKKRGELRYGYEEIIGQSPAMLKVFQVLDDVSETSIPVWIHGESGTGKELVARSLHVNSPRAKNPFVAENVSAIPETLLESELFGHKKGSFTHADRDRVGLFEQANGGTLFLDEVADMSLAMQAKLLRVLQEGEVRPVGASKKVKIDVRLVTASNKDLARMVDEGKFRQDLFFRINGLTINLPSLRNRKEDIPLLVRHFSKKIAKEFNLSEAEVTDRALKSLMAHNWPGNVRELEAVLRNALLFAKGKPIGPDHLTIKASSMAAAPAAEPSARPATQEDAAHRSLLVTTLKKHDLNKEEAAKELGVSLRTLYTWMEKHGLPKKKAVLAAQII